MNTGLTDDLWDDPVVTAALAADGVTGADLKWLVHADGDSKVADAYHRGSCSMDIRSRHDEDAAWFANVHFGDSVSYHAQRGRRSITLRTDIPETVAKGLVGRRANAIADAPGFDRMVIRLVRTMPGSPTTIIITPAEGEGDHQ
jgi:hypothetical protein